jgi:hypothetical protein
MSGCVKFVRRRRYQAWGTGRAMGRLRRKVKVVLGEGMSAMKRLRDRGGGGGKQRLESVTFRLRKGPSTSREFVSVKRLPLLLLTLRLTVLLT